MTEPKIQKKERFEITFPTERLQDWSTVAYLTFIKKQQKMGAVIETAFDVEFEKPATSNAITNPIKSISFWGQAGSEEKVRKVLDALMDDFGARTHFNRMGVEEITQQINETGSYKRPADAAPAAAANNNSAARHKREATQPQIDFEKSIYENDLSFGIGPAGTGKTYVAMKVGVAMLKTRQVKKLLLARPAQEAGENIGFLPGTQEDKLAPYMRPLYDELDKAFGRQIWKKMMENGEIEVVPVGFMRGRTFDDAFVIIDEAQNLKEEQLDMAVTRTGINCKVVVTGDPNQVDLKPKSLSALAGFVEIMRGEPGVGIQAFTEADVVRSKIVQTITDAIKRKRPSADFNAAAAPAAAAPAASADALLEKHGTSAQKARGLKKSALEKAVAAPTGKGTPAKDFKTAGEKKRKPAAMTANKKAKTKAIKRNPDQG